MKNMLASLVLPFLALVSLADRATAGIIVVAPTNSTSGSLQITADITFNITTAGSGQLIIFDEWVTSDGSQAFANLSPHLSISINGALPISRFGTFVDNLVFNQGQITSNDGYIFLNSSFSVSAGDTVTLKAATYNIAAISGFNQQASQTFIGNMFITDGNGTRLSNPVAVPEPSGLALVLTAGVVGLFLRRRSC